MLKRTVFFLFLAIFASAVFAQEAPETFTNPVIPGYHPDPSVCRVGDDYYLVNSSFEFYPGLPVFHSKDLVNWKLIGYGVHRPNQVELPEGLQDSRGTYAATIHYHEGTFYIINTCVNCKGNFYVTATNPAGPWSDPVWLNSHGIDPTLFWDDDGKCYYIGHGFRGEERGWPNQEGAWMQELDLEKGKLVGPWKQLTYGHASNARWTEGPHLYKINGKYMLMMAEGGTGFHHSVTIFNSDELWGPYIPNHANPVLTHRHLGYDYPIHSVGHADIIETQNGEWWAVMLAKRQIDGKTLLARETFLTPVRMEDQEGVLTPVFNPGIGKLLTEQKRPNLPWTPVEPDPETEEFEGEELALKWKCLRPPYTNWFGLDEGEREIDLRPEVVDSFGNPSFIDQRIMHHKWSASTLMEFKSKKSNEQAGLIIYRRSGNHYQLVREKNELVLIKTLKGIRSEVARADYKDEEVILKAEANDLNVTFSFGSSKDNMQQIGGVQDLSVISDEESGGFNGPFVGMYATSNGKKSKEDAEFEWFKYDGK